jgi:hypothetical protein
MGMKMNARRVSAIALALLVLAGASSPPPAGAGPAKARVQDNDNDIGNATSCTSGQSYPGSVDPLDDPLDLYTMQAPVSGQVFSVSIYVPTYPNCKMALELFDQNKAVLERSFIDSRYQSISFQAVKSATPYYVSVIAVSGSGDYTLSFNLETPAVIAPGTSVVDRPLARAGDNPCDWYSFAMAGSTNNGLNNDVAEFTVTKTAGMVLDVSIFALWTELAQHAYNHSLDHQSGNMITAAASYTGSYYVKVWARSGNGTYTISMGVLQSSLNDNDNIGTTATKLNNTPVSSWVDQAYDHYDFYKVFLMQGETLDVNMTLNQHTGGKYTMWLYHIVNNLYTPVTNATNFVPGLGWTDKVRLTHEVGMDNRYFLITLAEFGLDADGALSGTPANASYTLTLSSPADINHGPVFSGGNYHSTDENTQKVIFNLNTAFEDPDGDQMFFNVTGSANISAKINPDGGLLVTPARDWSGTEKVNVAAWDIYNKTTRVDVWVTVWNKNQAPRINRQIANFTLQEDRVQYVNISDAFYDPDIPYGDSLYYWWKGNSSIPMFLDNATMELSFGPVHGFLGTREITLYARDSAKPPLQAAMRFTVSVNHTNHQPVLKGASRIDMRTPEDTANQSFLARDFFYDEDTTYAKDVLTFTGENGVHANCTIGAESRIIVTPEADWSGEDTVFVRATDTGGLSAVLEVHMVVDPVNDAPRLRSYWPATFEYTINETENLTLWVEPFDIDSPESSLTYQWYVDGIKANSTNSSFTFATDTSSSRQLPYKISVEVGDGQFTFTQAWNIPVFNKNQPPVVTITSPRDGAVVSDQALTLLRADVYDAEHDNLAYTWKDGGATMGTARSMSWKFSPGRHNVSVHVFDGTDTTVANVTIFSNSQPTITIKEPGAESKRKTTDSIRFSAEVSDADGDPVTFEWREGSRVLSRSANFTMKLSKGLHYIKINASDGRSSVESDEIIVKVEEPPKSGFIPGTETALLAVAAAVAAAAAVWRRRRG